MTKEDILKMRNIEVDRLKKEKPMLLHNVLRAMDDYAEQVKSLNLACVTKSKNYPHCWGKMDWILKYKKGEEPKSSICNCEYGSSACLRLTRENANK